MTDLGIDPTGVPAREINRYSRIGLLLVALLAVLLVAWASITEIAGAVVSGGTIVVESSTKLVQHREGGVVAEIDAHNDEHVDAGQVLLRLDDTAIKASLAVVNNQLDEARAVEARLVAEVARQDDLAVPDVLANRQSEPVVAALLEAQRDLMAARRAVRLGNAQQLEQQVAQFNSQSTGLEAQKSSLDAQYVIVKSEFETLTGLRASNLIEATRLNDITLEKAQLEGQLGAVVAAQAQAQASVAERQVSIRQVDAKFLEDALADLQTLREQIAQLTQQQIAGRDRLARVTITAPQSGIVHESVVHTVGGVVGPGETLMQIVPSDDSLLIEVRLNPLDVDKVSVGQDVIVRIPGFNRRTAPDLRAQVTQMAPDATVDPATGGHYYLARVRFEAATLAQLTPAERLHPGMPAEAYIQTGNRTVLTYLLEPLLDQFRHAMRET